MHLLKKLICWLRGHKLGMRDYNYGVSSTATCERCGFIDEQPDYK
jgi:hypothetical protein